LFCLPMTFAFSYPGRVSLPGLSFSQLVVCLLLVLKGVQRNDSVGCFPLQGSWSHWVSLSHMDAEAWELALATWRSVTWVRESPW
jgi:hypothetical protein